MWHQFSFLRAEGPGLWLLGRIVRVYLLHEKLLGGFPNWPFIFSSDACKICFIHMKVTLNPLQHFVLLFYMLTVVVVQCGFIVLFFKLLFSEKFSHAFFRKFYLLFFGKASVVVTGTLFTLLFSCWLYFTFLILCVICLSLQKYFQNPFICE